MSAISFNWDENKNQLNKEKHNISFEEAKTVFYDEKARIIYDPDHSDDEDRFILLGMSFQLRILIVCHCYKESDEIIRIISARKANRKEQNQYKEFLS